MCVCVYAFKCVCVHVFECAHTRVRLCVYVGCVCVCVCVCACVRLLQFFLPLPPSPLLLPYSPVTASSPIPPLQSWRLHQRTAQDREHAGAAGDQARPARPDQVPELRCAGLRPEDRRRAASQHQPDGGSREGVRHRLLLRGERRTRSPSRPFLETLSSVSSVKRVSPFSLSVSVPFFVFCFFY